MTEAEAQKIEAEFFEIIEKYGLWWENKRDGKPRLKDIVIKVIIRVDEK